MEKDGREYLQSLVNSVICIEDAFRISLGNGKYIFSAMGDQKTNNYYAVSAIYDTICDTDYKIKYAFNCVMTCNIAETLDNYNPFSRQTEQEKIALYHVENMVYRISSLWDLLAQLCNVVYQTNIDPERIHYNRYFRDQLSKKTIPVVEEIVHYLNEIDDSNVDVNPWPGNHSYLNKYRNQMTHRVSPNISSFSMFGSTLKPPAIYILHRATEDYYKVSSFICRIINEYLLEYENWLPVGFESNKQLFSPRPDKGSWLFHICFLAVLPPLFPCTSVV